MDKELIQQKVIRAYKESKEFPDFLDRFKPAVQHIIDTFIPSEVTKPHHVYKDIEYLSEISKRKGLNTREFLREVSKYIYQIIKAYERQRKDVDFSGQQDIFDKDTDTK